jgi:hypothetical protein
MHLHFVGGGLFMKELQSVAASNVVVIGWIADDRYTPHYGYPIIWRPAAIIRLPVALSSFEFTEWADPEKVNTIHDGTNMKALKF